MSISPSAGSTAKLAGLFSKVWLAFNAAPFFACRPQCRISSSCRFVTTVCRRVNTSPLSRPCCRRSKYSLVIEVAIVRAARQDLGVAPGIGHAAFGIELDQRRRAFADFFFLRGQVRRIGGPG